jgi:hypothetical protein
MENWVIPYLREQSLWPVLFALLGHVVVILALALLATWRGEGVVGTVLMSAISVGLVGWEVRIFGRPGGMTRSVVLTWIAGIVMAAIGVHTGFV